MSEEAKTSGYVQESCLPGLELLLEHGLLTLDSNEEKRMNHQCHLGVLPIATTTDEDGKDGDLSVPPRSPKLIMSWARQQHVRFDDEGYVTLLDFGGKRLYKGFPCSIPATFGSFDRLTTLNLAGTDLPLQSILDILVAISTPIHHQHFECLYLGGNGLGDEGIKAIVASQCLPRRLRKLDLRYNDIQGEGMTALCQALPSSTKYLYMEGNQIGNDGIVALAELLEKCAAASDYENVGLQEVYLGANQLQSQAAQVLSQTLYRNKRLSKLYLEGNNIGFEGANAFATVLEELQGETALKNLFVDNNNIGKEGSKRLAKALNSSTSIGDAIF